MIPSTRSPASRQLVCNLGHARARTLGSSLGPAVASISSHHVSHSTSPLGCFNGTRRVYSTRFIHSSTNRPRPTDHLTIDNASSLSTITDLPPQPSNEKMPPKTPSPLAVLPLTNVLRSWMTTTVSSSPLLLPPSLAAMSVLAHTTNPALNPDRNPLLRAFLKRTFYAQFCAGENPAEVRQTIDSLKQIGFSGVILGYAREVVLSDSETADLASCATEGGAAAEECVRNEITPWAEGTMETVRLASPGDFVALKFTGAGRQALYALSKRLPPSEALGGAIDRICQLAAERGVRLLFDAEQTALQAGIDDWTLDYMRRYNTSSAVVYGTYQAYLKSTPATLSKHLAIAAKEGFTLGVKLVRGAYLGSDPRHLICDTKEDTDAQYDGIAESLLRKSWSAPLSPPAPRSEKELTFPEVSVVLATHNRDSVLKGKALLDSGKSKLGYDQVAFAQLQGMADEVSCELVSGPHETSSQMEAAEKKGTGSEEGVNKPQVYKYLVWGSTGECMKYLLRRAYENRDAVQRTRSGREAMGREVGRRVRGLFGLSA
ncbi:FAD-linked oxidoreductase-like protein [Sordaria brevicollis]|uniref:Proline dehydrogenase n=1 Tax=Sordaria brevicollis TaxID=83679 RepID=A0AAE0P9F4_SORBR|nr:FAD-linked oxidoreductase-like protein [Sordaria brevicollis]